MQQATQIQEQAKSEPHAVPAPKSAAATAFVINLCSSTSPVALSPPDHAGLKRFTFFVSRRREEGRERFRLHMGYFPTQEEAERLLDIVREIYPGAWAGLAPGQRLRAAAAAAAAQSAAPGPVSIERQVAPVAATMAPPALPVVAAAAIAEPVMAQPAVAATPPSVMAATVASVAPTETAAPVADKPLTAVKQEVSFSLLPEDLVRAAPHTATAAQSPASPVAKVQTEEEAAAQSLSDVRAAIASLEDSAIRKPELRAIPVLKIPELKPAAGASAAKSAPMSVTAASESAKGIEKDKAVEKAQVATVSSTAPGLAAKPMELAEELNDEAAMALLEDRSPVIAEAAVTVRPASAPEKTGVAAGPSTEKAVYAVQLMWSVQPIDIAQMPQLAIFSAYTLYGAEGNRDGRRWYGLRLGFFTDAVSAKQVAHYVRSEFSTVSVVPVTVRERERAKLASNRPAQTPAAVTAAVPAKAADAVKAPVAAAKLVSSTQFAFIEDKAVAPAPADPATGPRTGRGAPGKRAKLRNPATAAAARAKPKKLTLEETLEILGAGDLKVDDGRGELLNSDTAANAAAPRPQPAKAKPSRLGRLFERLSERIGS